MINKITIITESRNVFPDKNVLGIAGENKFETLQFNLDNFIDGQATLRVERKEDGKEKQYEIAVQKGKNCYTLEVLSSLLTEKGQLKMQLVIMQEELEVFKSKTFKMEVLEAIEGDEEIPEQYPSWQQLASQKIIEIDNKISEVDELEENLEDKVQSGYFKGEKGDTGEQGEKGQDGKDGKDGNNGSDGADGFSPIVTVQETENGANISITDKNGTTSVKVKNGKDGKNGEDGANGANGQDGYTPVIGTDYWTDADKKSIETYCKNYIDTNIAKVIGGAY